VYLVQSLFSGLMMSPWLCVLLGAGGGAIRYLLRGVCLNYRMY